MADPAGVTAPSGTQRVAVHGLLIQSTRILLIGTADGPSHPIRGRGGLSLLESFRQSDQINESIRRRLRREVEHTNIRLERRGVGAVVRYGGTTVLGHGLSGHHRPLDENSLHLLQSAPGNLPGEDVPRENYSLLERSLPQQNNLGR